MEEIHRPHEPELLALDELGVKIDDRRLSLLAAWVCQNASLMVLDHTHNTSRDGRPSSAIRKTTGLLNNGTATSDVEIVQTMKEIYLATAEYLTAYLGRAVTAWNTTYDAIGHMYLPGDGTSESHVDQKASATLFLEAPNTGGQLWIANNPCAQTIEEIMDDAVVLEPEPAYIAVFDGQVLPHFVYGVDAGAVGRRLSINMSLEDGSDSNGIIEYGYFAACSTPSQ
jgi:hypothetical protein